MSTKAPHQGKIPPLFKFLARHLLFGLTGGFIFGTAILYFDLGGIGALIMQSPDRGLWILLLYFGIFITFGSAAMGFGIMSLAGDENNREDSD